MNTYIQQLHRRYAVKKFDPNKTVPQEKIDILIETFRLTPSSLGLQPWKLVYLTNKELREKIAPLCWNDSQIFDSTGVFILCRKNDISDNLVDEYLEDTMRKTQATREQLQSYEEMMKGYLKQRSEQEKEIWAEKQVMIALGNMMTICAMEEIDSCPIEGFKKQEVDKILGLDKKGISSVVLLPVGYRSPDDKYAKKEKIRHEKEEIYIEIQ